MLPKMGRSGRSEPRPPPRPARDHGPHRRGAGGLGAGALARGQHAIFCMMIFYLITIIIRPLPGRIITILRPRHGGPQNPPFLP